ncbi:FHA domain-containing protein [bacterium]|nr:FHA domain-containing protein [bacterium]
MTTLTWNAPEGRREVDLSGTTVLGRSPRCDISIPDGSVSGTHATITHEAGAWVLQDEESTNGSYVNDDPTRRCKLLDGDTVRLGNIELTFRDTGIDQAESGATMLWQEGMAELPIPSMMAEAEESGFHRMSDVPELTEVSTVDPSQFTVALPVSPAADPNQTARRLSACYEIARATVATLDTGQVLDQIIHALFEIFSAADHAYIVLLDPETGETTTAAQRARKGVDLTTVDISRTAIQKAMTDRQAFLCRDASADEQLSQAQSILGMGIRSMMIAPLLFHDDVLGAVHVDSVHGIDEFTQPDLELLSVAASQVAVCIANARLHRKVVDSERMAAVGQTLAGLTHCIKNILQGIKGGGQIIDMGFDKSNDDLVRSGWDMVSRNATFMEELVLDLLTYSKERQPAYTPTDLNEVCEGICGLSGPRAAEMGVALSFTPDTRLELVEAEGNAIRRCILNLVANAVDACAESKASVTVSTHAPGDDGFVRIDIADTGCGMTEETLGKLFTVFFSTKGSKGTGLGLTVTKKIVEEHGGEIRITSELGVGTTFTLCLPPARPPTKRHTKPTIALPHEDPPQE